MSDLPAPETPFEVRAERPDDIPAVRDVNRRAFGQDQEANIVDALRANGAALLSLVAVHGGRVVGHVMYSPLTVGSTGGAALGPMAVDPDHQRRGIGSLLIEAGTSRLRSAGVPFVIVVGHAHFYPRFGFTPASAFGITCEWELPDEVFMIQILDGGAAGSLRGLAHYRHEFSTVA